MAKPVRPVPSIRDELGPLLGVLLMMVDEMRSVVVHLTSVGGGEGTTTVAQEVALAAAGTGWCKVALLGARGRLPWPGDAGDMPGLVGQFEKGEEPTLRMVELQGVQVATGLLNSGHDTISRAETVRGLYAQLRSRFQLVLVDCPPVLTGRAAMAGTACDGVVLVVEAERSRVDDILRAREMIEQSGANVLGLVLNKQRSRVPRFIRKLM